ncbi:glycosyltransferase family 4 protein [Streptococcus suis]|nr:glycosyltransferase family 4 protein [Streptococcus suis]
MKKISILHLSQVSGGGVEKYIKLFLKYSDVTKFTNYLVAPNLENYDELNGYLETSVDFNMEQTFSPIKIFKNVFFIRKVIKEISPDIVYLHSTFAGVVGRIASIGLPTKVVYNPHGWSFKMDNNYLKKLLFKLIEFLLSFLTDKFILISKSEFALANQISVNKSKLSLINNGVEVSQCYSLNKIEEIFPNEDFIIGMVGRLSPPKEYFFFIDFAKQITQIRNDTNFIIVGDGELRSEIEKMVLDNGLQDKIFITGWVDNPRDYIEKFDQAILFSRWEGLSLTIAEYMSQKKPILATNIGGINDLITEGETGMLIEVGDLDSAVSKSFELRNNHELSKYLANNAYSRVVEQFSIEKQMAEIESLFIEMCNNEK